MFEEGVLRVDALALFRQQRWHPGGIAPRVNVPAESDERAPPPCVSTGPTSTLTRLLGLGVRDVVRTAEQVRPDPLATRKDIRKQDQILPHIAQMGKATKPTDQHRKWKQSPNPRPPIDSKRALAPVELKSVRKRASSVDALVICYSVTLPGSASR